MNHSDGYFDHDASVHAMATLAARRPGHADVVPASSVVDSGSNHFVPRDRGLAAVQRQVIRCDVRISPGFHSNSNVVSMSIS